LARRHVEHLRLAAVSAAGRLALHQLAGARHDDALVDAENAHDLLDHAAGQTEYADEKVLSSEHAAGAATDHALSRLDSLTGTFRELVHIHGASFPDDLVPTAASAQWDQVRLGHRDQLESMLLLDALDLAASEHGGFLEAGAQTLELAGHGLQLRFHGKDALNACQIEPHIGEFLDAAQAFQIHSGVATCVLGSALWTHQTTPLIQTQRLRMHPRELGRH